MCLCHRCLEVLIVKPTETGNHKKIPMQGSFPGAVKNVTQPIFPHILHSPTPPPPPPPTPHHWRELPQVSFLSRRLLSQRRDKNVCGATKHVFCGDKNMLVATKLSSSRQTRVCRDEHKFVVTSIFLSRQA